MASYQVLFWAKFRGTVKVIVYARPGLTADNLAKKAITLAMLMFNRKWPGLHKDELRAIRAELHRD